MALRSAPLENTCIRSTLLSFGVSAGHVFCFSPAYIRQRRTWYIFFRKTTGCRFYMQGKTIPFIGKSQNTASMVCPYDFMRYANKVNPILCDYITFSLKTGVKCFGKTLFRDFCWFKAKKGGIRMAFAKKTKAATGCTCIPFGYFYLNL